MFTISDSALWWFICKDAAGDESNESNVPPQDFSSVDMSIVQRVPGAMIEWRGRSLRIPSDREGRASKTKLQPGSIKLSLGQQFSLDLPLEERPDADAYLQDVRAALEI